MTKTHQFLRWLAVLPGALLAGVIVMFPIHWTAMYIHHFGAGEPLVTTDDGRGFLQSLPTETLERFGYALFLPGTIIYVGACIAPRFHFATALALTAMLLSLVSYLLLHLSSTGLHIADSTFRLVVTAFFWLLSVTYACVHSREFDEEI